MRIMYGCALLCASLSCDNPPRSREERLRLLEHRVATLEAVTDNHDIDLAAMRRRQDKERVTAEAETAGLVARKPATAATPERAADPCTDPHDESGWDGSRLSEWQVSDPPAGLPEFKIYYGVWDERACLSATSPCQGLPRSNDLDAGSLATCGYPVTTSWSKLLRSALDSFYAVPSSYRDSSFNKTNVYAAYGLLQSLGGGLGSYDMSTHHDFRANVLRKIYGSRRLTGLLYDWAMPQAKIAWQMLSSGDRGIYLDILTHGQHFLSTYNHKRELAYLVRLERGKCAPPEWLSDNDGDGVDDDHNGQTDEDVGEWNPKEDCPGQFTSVGPDGKENLYRKFEAFFFRRARDGVKVADMRYWLDRVVAELRPLTPAAATAAK
ncbi:MAG: hypothetical protein Q7R80_00185 [bacterium]|nr:hypothetical protein [bacterium]